MLICFGRKQQGTSIIYYDNISIIKLYVNPITQCRSNHIDVRFLFLGDLCKVRAIKLKYCKTGLKMVVIFTKTLQ